MASRSNQRGRRALMFSLTWVTYACFYLARKSLAVVKVAVEEAPRTTLNLTREQFGFLDSIYLGAYALGQFGGGRLTDRYGPRRILITGLLLIILSSLFLGFVTGLLMFAGLLIVHGFGQATGWPSCLKVMSQWFSTYERGRIMGWWCTCYTVGAAVAAPFVAWCMVHGNFLDPAGSFGEEPFWPAGFWGPALVLTGILGLVVWLLQDSPENDGKPALPAHGTLPASEVISESSETATASHARHVPSILQSVIRQPAVWILAISYFSIKLTRYGFYFWGPKYVQETLGSDTLASAMISAALPVGGVFGILASGYISDRCFRSRRAPVAVISLSLAVATLLISRGYAIQQESLMAILFGLIGFFIYGPDSLISASAAMDVGTRSGTGTATGLVNAIGSIGAMIGAFLPGVLTSADHWDPAFYVFTGGLIASALVLLPLWHKPPAS